MPEKKTNKTTANNKKVAAKKPETNKSESKKVEAEVKETVAKVEKKVEAFEAKTDKEVDNLVKKVWFVDKIINASWVKEILNLSFMEKANVRVRKNLGTICKVLGILWLILWCIYAVYAIIWFILWIIALSELNGAARVLFLFIITLVCAALILIISRWLMKMKKWFPAVAIICIAIDIIILILSIFVSWLSFWTELLSLIIWVIFTLFILKNKDMFKN